MKTALLSLLVLAFPLAARADVPPPDDYVETCTVEKQTKPGLDCKSCSAWHGEPDACDKTLGKDGYAKKCQSWGASSWGEVWCKGTETPAEKPAEKPADKPAETSPAAKPASASKCAAGGVELQIGLAAALLMLVRRARRA
ncbi:MAG: hypothetical protein U1F43_02975 [Myxococcota bacterium]